MNIDFDQKLRAGHWAWAVLLAAIPLAAGLHGGPLFYDDAYITFRYAQNLADGSGFVYNSTPVLGATAPLYCLVLTAGRLVGVPIPWLALAIGLAGAAACPVLVWFLGRVSGRNRASFLAGALALALFPRWWQAGLSGMETTMAAAFALGVIILDFKKRTLAAGVLSGLLVLTRPDAATLPFLLVVFALGRDPLRAVRLILGAALCLAPWVIYSLIVFGTPAPQSLAAKQLIHAFPLHLALVQYLKWFGSFTAPPLMIVATAGWLMGLYCCALSRREWAALLLWPPLFIMGLSYTGVGPFTWYKFPILPAFFAGAGLGLSGAGEVLPERFKQGWVRLMGAGLVAVFIVLQLVEAWPLLSDRAALQASRGKENIFREMAAVIRADSAGLLPRAGKVKALAGEVGVLGWELLDFEVIDSAGINSPEVYEIRRQDWASLKGDHPGFRWPEQWWGTEAWPLQVIELHDPDYIASDSLYLHLKTLVRDPRFTGRYEILQFWPYRDEIGERPMVVFKKKQDAPALPASP